MTQFQIEGGGVVQGVTKFILTFSAFVTKKKNYVNTVYKKKKNDSSFLGSEKFFKKVGEKIQHLFSHSFYKKKHKNFGTTFFLHFKKCSKP